MKNTVLEYLRQTVERYGDKTAVVDGERRMTFEQLTIAGKKIGYYLHLTYKSSGQPVAVLLPKSVDGLIAFLGILYSGNFYVPLDEQLPGLRLKRMIDNLQPMAVITAPEYETKLLAAGVNREQLVMLDKAASQGSRYDGKVLETILAQIVDTDPVYIIYTSGSTGVPKGVVISHRSVIDYIDWAVRCFQVDSKTVIGNQSPFYFDNSTLDIYLCLAAGATLVLVPAQYFIFPAKLMEYVNVMKINFIFWVPFVLVNVANRHILESMAGSALTKILFAGEVMPNKHLNYWRRYIPDALYANLYGPTEITVDCTYYIVKREFADQEPLPIGIPCSNSNILVLNNEGRPVAGHEPGELCVRGSSLALGYWNDPDKTKAAFMQNPLHDHYPERIYRTGDLVYYNDHKEIMYISRKDRQVKHRGYRIELGEIENAALSLQEVEHACVVYNKNRQEIVLIYRSLRTLTIEYIRKNLLPLLPKYMLPAVAYRLNEMPLNANGKIDRPVLESRYGG
ncbi:MAG: amino acid adenylation domain-containing protein [Veillonellales bacterium]